MKQLGLSYAEVHPLVCDQPRRLLGLPVPTLEAGERADVVLLQRDGLGVLRHVKYIIGGITDFSITNLWAKRRCGTLRG